MKRSFLSGLVFAALCLSSTYKVKADFGSADITSKKKEITKFDAWCGKRGDDCTVEFAADRIIIDGTSSVKYDKIKSFTYDQIASTCASGQVFFCRKKQFLTWRSPLKYGKWECFQIVKRLEYSAHCLSC